MNEAEAQELIDAILAEQKIALKEMADEHRQKIEEAVMALQQTYSALRRELERRNDVRIAKIRKMIVPDKPERIVD